ncbi:Wd-40 repeat protein [Mycena kentingensis (nom. inval.)]|nr:Wd-40 repeat protein [Mycena kentingensis (nom. inval.)]
MKAFAAVLLLSATTLTSLAHSKSAPTNNKEFFEQYVYKQYKDFAKDGVPATNGCPPLVSSKPSMFIPGAWKEDEGRADNPWTMAFAVSPMEPLAAVGVAGDVYLYNYTSGALLRTYKDISPIKSGAFPRGVKSIQFHRDGQKMVVENEQDWQVEKNVVVVLDVHGAAVAVTEQWGVGANQEVLTDNTSTQAGYPVIPGALLSSFDARAFSRNGKSLIVNSGRNKLVVFDFATFAPRFTIGHTDYITWAEFSNDDKYIVSASWDGTVRIWAAQTGESLHILRFYSGQNWSGAFAPDGIHFAIGSGDGRVRLYNVHDGRLVDTFGSFKFWTRTLSFSPDSRLLAAGAGDGTLAVFDLPRGIQVQDWIVADSEWAGPFLEVRRVEYTLRGDLFFRDGESRVFGYRGGEESALGLAAG